MPESKSKVKQTQSLGIFPIKSDDKINWAGFPYAIRNNCKYGDWRKDEENVIANSLDIAIVHFKSFYGSLGKTKKEQWLQVWFIPAPNETQLPKNQVCVTYLKGESLTILTQAIIEAENDTCIFKASFTKRKGDYGDYFVVNFEPRFREDNELHQVELIRDFLEQKDSLIDPALPESMIAYTDQNSLEQAQADVAVFEEARQRKLAASKS